MSLRLTATSTLHATSAAQRGLPKGSKILSKLVSQPAGFAHRFPKGNACAVHAQHEHPQTHLKM